MHNHVASEAADGSVTREETQGEVMDALRDLRDQGKARFWGMTVVGETNALLRVIDSATLNNLQSAHNLVNPSAGSIVSPGYDMPEHGNLIERASASGMEALVIRALAAGALTGRQQGIPWLSRPSRPLGTGRDYGEDLARSDEFRFLQ